MKRLVFGHRSFSTDTVALLVRLTLGLPMLTHGYTKIIYYHDFATSFPNYTGLGSVWSFNLLVFAEFFCSAFVVLGFATRLSAIPIFIAMAVACFVAHAGDPFGERELSVIYMGLSVITFVIGSGRWSFDKLIFKNRD